MAPSGGVDADEAVAFVTHPELGGDRSLRGRQVRAEIERSGAYEQTFPELELGARLAWRNSPRCIGRLHWKSLRLRDRRDCSTPSDIAEECFTHLRESTNGGRIRPVVTVFGAARPGRPAIRIWNSQLIRYAGYRQSDGRVVGDPLNVALTGAIQRLGWRGPGGPFDVLPLVIQVPGEAPQWFEVPPDAVLEVPLTHPDLPWFADLGLRWHAVPAISDMALVCGGLTYPAAPFSGWYLSTEIAARNLSDTTRYDMLPVIADRMGLDRSRDRTLWRDRALVELSQAVLHSYRQAGVTILDHHSASRQFVQHEEREAQAGRAVNADWAWLVPPMSASLLATYHRSYPPPDFSLRPNWFRQPQPFSALGPAAAGGCPVTG